MIRLADGVVVGRDLRVWAPGRDGVPTDAANSALRPGTAVAVGPAGRTGDEAAAALRELGALVAAGGVVTAGAGVDLGGGFQSARLAGGRGDRRDAVLAALRVLGVEQADRLGERAAVLVALFGPEVTRPVGTAAAHAIGAGHWPALHLATAASDLLGPEQLEQVLSWTAPQGTDPVPHGLASVLAEHLDRVFGTLPRPRRLALLRDVWESVCADQWRWRRPTRLPSFPLEVTGDDVAKRYRQHFDDLVESRLRQHSTTEPPTLASAARWTPDSWTWALWLRRAVHDALAATALLRVAMAVADHGVAEGIEGCRELIGTAEFLVDKDEATAACRLVPGQAPIPARPAVYLRHLHRLLAEDDGYTEAYVLERLATAPLYGRAVLDNLEGLLFEAGRTKRPQIAEQWHCEHFTQWRTVAGYSPVRPPESWDEPPLLSGDPSLAQRRRGPANAAAPNPAAAANAAAANAAVADELRRRVETQADMLWYAELADALVQLDGHDAAEVNYAEMVPYFELKPERPEAGPLRPGLESVPLAVAGAAQLVELGATGPDRPRTWAALVDGLLASATIAEALTGTFPVPAELSTMDGVSIPGTGVRLELARSPQQLAEWSAYMGNCIAGSYYLDEAAAGRTVLAALRDPDGRLVANIELLPTGNAGWHVEELRARFNHDPEPELERRIEEWVATLPGVPRRLGPSPTPRAHTRGRPRRQDGLREVGEALDALAGEALRTEETIEAQRVLDTPAITPVTTGRRRHGPERFDQAVRETLADRAAQLVPLWRATAVRPLAGALSRLDPRLRDRYANLDALAADSPLPPARRRLARLPEVAQARAMDLAALRLRAALGRLVRGADPVLPEAVTRYADTPLLCAMVLAVSTACVVPDRALAIVLAAGRDRVPGYPESWLCDPAGPWQRAWPDATELGADPQWTGQRIRLRVPNGWLGRGGWPALWGRAAGAGRRAAARRAEHR
jgi:hypothetical protein